MSEKKSAVVEEVSQQGNQLFEELRKNIVAILIAIPSFLIAVPYLIESAAETFQLHPALAFRMFGALYFSLVPFLVLLWYLNYMRRQLGVAPEEEPDEGEETTPLSQLTRRPLLFSLGVLYLLALSLGPYLASPATGNSDLNLILGGGNPILAIFPILLFALALGYFLWRELPWRIEGGRSADSASQSGRSLLLLHFPMLMLAPIGVASLILFSFFLETTAMWGTLIFLLLALLGTMVFVGKEGGLRPYQLGGFVFTFLLIALWTIPYWPEGSMTPETFGVAQSTLFNNELPDSLAQPALTRRFLDEETYLHFKRISSALDSMEVEEDNTIRRGLGTRIVARGGESIDPTVEALIAYASSSRSEDELGTSDSGVAREDSIDQLLSSLSRKSDIDNARRLLKSLRTRIERNDHSFLPVLLVAQWKGLGFLGLTLLSLIAMHFLVAPREKKREGVERELEETTGFRKIVSVVDGWIVILVLLAIPLFMPAEHTPEGLYGGLRAPQWFLPNIEELPRHEEATAEVPGPQMDTLVLKVTDGSVQNNASVAADIKALLRSNQELQVPLLLWMYENRYRDSDKKLEIKVDSTIADSVRKYLEDQ